jgi:hypothetical protein
MTEKVKKDAIENFASSVSGSRLKDEPNGSVNDVSPKPMFYVSN